MNIGRFFGGPTKTSTSFVRGQIQTREQIQAAKAVHDLENEALKISDRLFALDETESDLNSGFPDVVAVASNTEGCSGFASRSKDGPLTKLDATNGSDTFRVTNEGDNKSVSRTREIEGSDGGVLFIEHSAVYFGDKVTFTTREGFR